MLEFCKLGLSQSMELCWLLFLHHYVVNIPEILTWYLCDWNDSMSRFKYWKGPWGRAIIRPCQCHLYPDIAKYLLCHPSNKTWTNFRSHSCQHAIKSTSVTYLQIRWHLLYVSVMMSRYRFSLNPGLCITEGERIIMCSRERERVASVRMWWEVEIMLFARLLFLPFLANSALQYTGAELITEVPHVSFLSFSLWTSAHPKQLHICYLTPDYYTWAFYQHTNGKYWIYSAGRVAKDYP